MKGDSIMEYLKKSGFAKTFSIWFGIGALMFGTYCGANMASGVYASAYIVTLGGGWSLVWLSIFFAFMTFFCAISLVFIRIYKVKNYNQYYLALYGWSATPREPIWSPAWRILTRSGRLPGRITMSIPLNFRTCPASARVGAEGIPPMRRRSSPSNRM